MNKNYMPKKRPLDLDDKDIIEEILSISDDEREEEVALLSHSDTNSWPGDEEKANISEKFKEE